MYTFRIKKLQKKDEAKLHWKVTINYEQIWAIALKKSKILPGNKTFQPRRETLNWYISLLKHPFLTIHSNNFDLVYNTSDA